MASQVAQKKTRSIYYVVVVLKLPLGEF